MKSAITCAHCGNESSKERGTINRAEAIGAPLYCNRTCAGLARRRKEAVTREQLIERKRLYDIEYRKKNEAALKTKKAAFYRENRDPEREREIRKARMPKHVEYCRRPEYVAYKAKYDLQHRASEYGVFADAYMLLLDVEKELRARATKYERMKAKGYFTRNAQQRRRQLWAMLKSIRLA